MRWFKHMSDLPRDEGISRYLDAAGKDRLTAYGFLMLLLEAIASRMSWQKGALICSATYSITHWGRITYCHPNRVTKYLGLCGVIGWVQVEFVEGSCRVTVPRMVEWRDETTRKSGIIPEPFAQRRGDKTRKEKRESRQNDALSDCLTAKSTRLTPPPDFEITEVLQEWAMKNYPSVDIWKETAKFTNYECPKPISDWEARWKLWIQRAYERQMKNNGTSSSLSRNEQLLKLGKDLGVEKQPDESKSQYCERLDKFNQRRIDGLKH